MRHLHSNTVRRFISERLSDDQSGKLWTQRLAFLSSCDANRRLEIDQNCAVMCTKRSCFIKVILKCLPKRDNKLGSLCLHQQKKQLTRKPVSDGLQDFFFTLIVKSLQKLFPRSFFETVTKKSIYLCFQLHTTTLEVEKRNKCLTKSGHLISHC